MSNGDSVTIVGATTSHGIDEANLNGTFTIAGVKRNSYTYTAGASDVASTSGVGGGLSMSATQNLAFNILHPVVQSLTFPGTAMGWGIRDTSVGGSLSSSYLSVVPNSNYYPKVEKVIESGSTPTMVLAGTMRSTKNN